MKIKRFLKQKAVYWAPAGNNGFGPTFSAGVEIDCRWEGKEMQFVNRDNETKVSRAVVFVDQVLEVGGYLFLGLLTDLTSGAEADPTEEHNAYEIQSFPIVPNMRNTQDVRKAIL